MNPVASLKRSRLIRWLFQNTILTGDNVRLVTQRPLVRRMFPRQCETALDAGAGSGEYTRSVVIPRAQQVLTVDIQHKYVGQFARRLDPAERAKCLPTVGTLTHIPASDGAFDAILCSEVLEHCEDDDGVIAEFARVMRPGGVLVITVPVPPAPYPDNSHVREGYTLAELSAVLERHGFEVTDHAYCLFAISKQALKWRIRAGAKVPLPFMCLIHLERLLYARAGADCLPFDVVVRAVRK